MAHRLHQGLPHVLAGAWRGHGIAALLLALAAERDRWILWLPVAFGLGIAIYFALPSEPDPWVIPLALPLVCLLYARLWHQARDRQDPHLSAVFALGAVVMLVGFAIAQCRTYQVDAPVLERRGAYQVEGEILLVEPRVKGERLLIGHPTIADLPQEETPEQVRFTRRSAEPPLQPGDRISARAMLMPPSPPSEPMGSTSRAKRSSNGSGL